MDVPTVYIVDDDAAIRAATRRLLGPTGQPVLTFASAEQFLAETTPDARGCLVLDLSLPGMSGLQLQDEMAKAGWTVPIVFITSHFDQGSYDAAMQKGAVAFLRKPFECDKLLSIVCATLAGNAPDAVPRRPVPGGRA
jgi:FixJ family two-component response regulator